MSAFTAIDLIDLPAPDLIEALNFELIYEAMRADFIARHPLYSAVLESDPAIKLIEAAAYRELQMRQDFNERARACLLAKARANDLENLAAFFGVARRLLDAGDPDAFPPVSATYEDDASLRQRAQLALEALSVAGAEGAYVFHTLSAGQQPSDFTVESPEEGIVVATYRYPIDPIASQVRHASVHSPVPGQVVVTVLSRIGDGIPSAPLLALVNSSLNASEVRPLTDQVIVNPAEIIPYEIEASLIVYDGPDSEVVRSAAEAAAIKLATKRHRLGDIISRSALDAALNQPGVQKVIITKPAAEIACLKSQAAYCTNVTVTIGGLASV